jgi:Cu-Zn family superoxide dismutase
MKKIFIGIFTLGLMLGATSCKDKDATSDQEVEEVMEVEETETEEEESPMEAKTVVIAMGSKSGSDVSGTVTLTQEGEEVAMVVELTGLSQGGTHAMHIHENGDCSSDDGKSAGGHWNPTEHKHGKWGEGMYHSGDIGNLEANEAGEATLTFSTDQWCIGCDDETKNVIGKSFIVHASADDFTSQPSGAAGARVACGVIE